MNDTTDIGTRIRTWRRRRGLTQAVLADLAGMTQGHISKIEAGTRTVDSRRTLIALAGALRVSAADLLGEPGDPTDPTRAEAAAAILDVRTAIVALEEGVPDPPQRPRDATLAAIDDAERLRNTDGAQVSALKIIPGLLRDAAALHGAPLVRVATLASLILRRYGHRDLALSAARLAVTAAEDEGNAAWIGAARFHHGVTLPIESPQLMVWASQRAVDDLDAHAADPNARQALGMGHLVAAHAASITGRHDTCGAHLETAGALADSLGDPADGLGFANLVFGPTNVGVWRMTLDTELGDDKRVLAIAPTLHPGRMGSRSRVQTYWTTLGRAYVRTGDDTRAVAALRAAESTVPELFAVDPLVRQAVTALIGRARRRAVSGDLGMLASRAGIAVA